MQRRTLSGHRSPKSGYFFLFSKRDIYRKPIIKSAPKSISFWTKNKPKINHEELIIIKQIGKRKGWFISFKKIKKCF